MTGNVSSTNSIIANNNGIFPDCGSPINSLGHNIDSDGTCGLTAAGDQSNTDPMLRDLLPGGGSGSPMVHALMPGSPAIDAGDNAACPAKDQRGVVRPVGAACDVGAFELDPGTPIPGVSSWGMIALAGLLGAAAVWRLRRRSYRWPA